MGALALLWVAIGFMDQEYSNLSWAVGAAEVVLWFVFMLEFSARFAASYNRRAYFRGHWIDAVALIPAVRGVRLVRLLRLLRLVRAFSGMYRAAMQVERLSRHRGFAALLVAWLTVTVLCSAFVFVAENGTSKLMTSPFDALWWGVTTITTVGYGDTYPVTPEGRLGAMVLMILGIGMFSAITATMTSFVTSQQRSTAATAEDIVGRLESLADLWERGALSDDEYKAAKTAVLQANSSPTGGLKSQQN